MKLILAAAAGLAALSLGACAATTEGTNRQELVDAGQLTGDRSDGGRVRCESVRETGSRMSTRVCLWDEMEENAQQVRRDRDEQGNVALPSSGGIGGGQ